MRVLIIKKATTLDLRAPHLRSMAERGAEWADLLRAAELSHAEHVETLAVLRRELHAAGIQFIECQRTSPRPEGSSFDAYFAVGGDGTVLAASRRLTGGGLVFGIRSSRASVGWLCAGSVSNIGELVTGLRNGDSRTAQVQRMVVRVENAATGEVVESFPIFNDCLYIDQQPGLSTRYTISWRGVREKQKSSGIWISTPVGSSGAIRAAGGVGMPLEERALQFKVRELFATDSSVSRLTGGLFHPEQDSVVIENESDRALIACDGRHGMIPVGLGDRITFRFGAPLTLALPRQFS